MFAIVLAVTFLCHSKYGYNTIALASYLLPYGNLGTQGGLRRAYRRLNMSTRFIIIRNKYTREACAV